MVISVDIAKPHFCYRDREKTSFIHERHEISRTNLENMIQLTKVLLVFKQ